MIPNERVLQDAEAAADNKPQEETTMAMNIILWIVFGAIVGWIASMIAGTNAQQGPIANIVVGIVGAMIGGWVANAFGAAGVTGFNLGSFIVALLGAVVLLFIVRMFTGRTHHHNV
jgi:uncharacterized membrane protein YeaQ/YmgE (transglycosylase-associated protein family)